MEQCAAAICWTGGKDSCLALHLASEAGLQIKLLVTFVPSPEKEFQAHPQTVMREQAEALGLPILFLPVKEPFFEGYQQHLKRLVVDSKINVLVTGDIDEVDGQSNWIEACAKGTTLTIERPLWKKDRRWILSQLFQRDIDSTVTWINSSHLPASWVGRRFDADFVRDLEKISLEHEIDLCGENGEFHTMVVECPRFSRSVTF